MPDPSPRKTIATVLGPIRVAPECKLQAVCTSGLKCWEAGCCLREPEQAVTLALSEREARDVHHALSMAVDLMRQVGDIPPEAPLYGAEDRLLLIARRLSHERTHKGAVPNPNTVGGEDR